MRQIRSFLLVLTSVWLCEQALAGSLDTKVEAEVDAAISDWEPSLTCSVLEPEGFKIVTDLWNSERAQIAPRMLASGIDEAVVRRILKKTEVENVMIKTKGSAKDLIDYCNSHPDWNLRWTQFDIVLLGTRIKKALD